MVGWVYIWYLCGSQSQLFGNLAYHGLKVCWDDCYRKVVFESISK